MGQVFIQFLWLGCVSFGGPAAHIGYFQRTFVERLGWLSQAEFAQLLALCQLLPGPASSQLGFAIGRHKAGLGGALAAFLGFTLPSFLLLMAAAIGVGQLTANLWLDAALHGLKLLALVVVAPVSLAMAPPMGTWWKSIAPSMLLNGGSRRSAVTIAKTVSLTASTQPTKSQGQSKISGRVNFDVDWYQDETMAMYFDD